MSKLKMALQNPAPYFKVLRNSFIADIEYRSSYYVLILSSFITVFMELTIFRKIFEYNDTAGDLHKSQALSFIVLGMLIRNGAMLWSMVSESIDQIRDGSFRKFLIQPLHYPSFFIAQTIGPKLTTWTLSLITVFICKQFSDFQVLLPAARIPQFLLCVGLAYFLTWQFYMLIVYLAFWVEEASFLSTAFNIGMGIFTGTLIPLSWFPDWFRNVITWTPFPLMGNFPVLFGIGAMTDAEYFKNLIALLAWTIVIILLNSVLQKKAFTRFEAYGG